MSQIDEEILSETTSGLSNNDNLKLVPVAESIRYRKRAQSAEKEVEILAEQLAQAKSKAEDMAEQLNGIKVEQSLTRKLAAAGTVDMETTVLIAKARLEGKDESDLDSVVEQLRKEKHYLFGDSSNAVATKRTSGAKNRVTHNETVLTRAAKRASTTGNRADLQEYLKLRRNFV